MTAGAREGATQAGFALVEALTALVVSGIAAAGLLAALSSARDRAEEARVRDLALRQARHLLMEAVGDASAADGAGQAADGRLTWTRRVSAVGATGGLYSVIVEVEWTTRRKTGTTRLETYAFTTS